MIVEILPRTLNRSPHPPRPPFHWTIDVILALDSFSKNKNRPVAVKSRYLVTVVDVSQEGLREEADRKTESRQTARIHGAQHASKQRPGVFTRRCTLRNIITNNIITNTYVEH